MKTLFKNFNYFNNSVLQKDCFLVIDGNTIAEISSVQPSESDFDVIDLQGNYLSPGFVDLQINGGKEVFFTHDITEETLETMYHDHLMYGTTDSLPTLVSTTHQNMLKALQVTKNYMATKPGVLGLHIEGPFFNFDKRGAHNPKYIRNPSDAELEELLTAGEGIIKMMTIAPEIFTDAQLEKIRSKNIVISVGHSNISEKGAKQTFSKGINCVTHLFNAMSPFQSREAGLTGAALDSDVYAGIIVDGVHCVYTAVRIAYKLKKGKLFLITDATFIGKKDLEMDGIKFIHKHDHYVNPNGNLAGSNITMADAIKKCVENVFIPLPETLKMATEIPLEVLGITNKGKIKAGYMADFAVLDKEDLSVKLVVKNGAIVSKDIFKQ